jgi:phospholipase/lecithinase/hemolysin
MICNLYEVVNKYRDIHLDSENLNSATDPQIISNFQRYIEFNQGRYKFSQIYVFGDSLCDTGNSFNTTKKALGAGVPATPPYFSGRFSNGRVWVEYFAQLLGLNHDKCKNFAVGGATTGTTNTLIPDNAIGLPGLQQQIARFLRENPQADSQALYIIWAGANDYLNGGVTNHTTPSKNLSNAVKLIANVGAKNIIVLNLPDLGFLPIVQNDSQKSGFLTNLTQLHNSTLASSLDQLKQSFRQGQKIILIDVYSLFNQVFANPKKFNLTNVRDSALAQYANSQGCNEKFFFWDEIHPTTTAHMILAKIVLEILVPIRDLSLIER